VTCGNHIFLLLWILMLAIPVSAQQLVCENPVPADFRVHSSHKFERSKDSLRSERKRARKTEEGFLRASHFLNDAILNSGRVLFNDPVSTYLNEILDVLLEDDPVLRKKVRAYALRSTAVNAFATDNGVILVNLGLIARAKNEAQLAFILSHELSHFVGQHVFDAFLKNKEVFAAKGDLRSSGVDDKTLALGLYSKELEMAADSAALARMVRTDYGTAGMFEVFDVLHSAHLPFSDSTFHTDFFAFDGYQPDSTLLRNRTNSYQSISSKNEVSESHPEPKERQDAIVDILSTVGKTESNLFVVSESRFEQCRSLSRRALVDLYGVGNDPLNSIYSAYVLLKADPKDNGLKLSIARGLYSISKHANHGRKQQVISNYSDQHGQLQQLAFFLYRMSNRELNMLALRYLWDLRLEMPDDPDLAEMAKDALMELVRYHHSKLPFSKSEEDSPSNNDPVKLALVPLFNDSAFTRLFEVNVVVSRMHPTIEQNKWSYKQDRKKERYHKNHGFAVGADKAVFVDPQYGRYDHRRRKSKLYKSSEAAGAELCERIERSADLVQLPVTLLSKGRMDSMDAELFNDITFLNEWVDQRFRGLEIDMVVSDRIRLDALIKKYGTDYFVWTGMLTYREKKPFLSYYLMYALVPPAFPIALYYLLRSNHDSYYFCVCFNLKTGEPEMITYNNFKQRDARDLVNSNVFDSLYQLKRKPNN
jgi:hypothetical protein